MAKMSRLNITQTNKFLGALDYISQFIDVELMPLTKFNFYMQEQLITLQRVVDDYREEIKDEIL